MFRVLSACADGARHDGEACDDGNMLDGDGCGSSCLVELGWICEEEPQGLYADGWGRGPSKCRAAGMDGIRVGDEECDDCNLQAGDGCDNGRVEPGHICVYKGRFGIETSCPGVLSADRNNYLTFTADECRIPCGDGIRHIVAGEECDDGNVIDGDGCTSDCRIESGYECPTIGWPQVLLTPCHPICGDGLRLGAEECDDNNTVSGDGCGPDCKVELGWFCKRAADGGEVCLNTCLNGIIDPGEECDDANTFHNDGCANCIVELGWKCETILNRATSTSSGSYCFPVCGDGFRIEFGSMAEQCDDGNSLAGDGCDPNCRIEPGWTCRSQASEVNTTALRCEPICGDGLLVGGEACDDGNQDSGDGCSGSCKVETGFVCAPEDSFTKSEVAGAPAQNRTVCVPICGDGRVLLKFGEACDDGNRVPGDGCDENCQVEAGYTCGSTGTSSASMCSPVCGDGLLLAPEQCDDGNVGKGDGCDEQCQLEQGYQCWPPGVPCRFLCGDFLRLEGEACDDGNLNLEDGCDSACQVEDGWICRSYVFAATNATSVCTPICGDGKLRGTEACDDGNLAGGDGCDENCTVEAGWTCCETAGAAGSSCSGSTACESTCGNGQRDAGEACDDGNLVAADGCSPTCEVEAGFACVPMGHQQAGRKIPDYCEAICGDGLLVVGEECDDGNQVGGDGCGPNCEIEQAGTLCPPLSDINGAVCRATCGDGVRGPREECDDGNSFGGDGCSRNCQVERGFTCSGGGLNSRDTCWPICGDGLRVDRAFSSTLADKLEACDTGPIPSRGCDISTCQVRAGWTCERPAAPSMEVCTPICGDGVLITPIEECDDGNNQPGDGCSPDCKVEAMYECSYDAFFLRSVCQVSCGDGRQHATEACDDGNNWDQDGCSSTCQPEPGFECCNGTQSLPSDCKPICGDGFEVYGETCDDGNLVPWDGCNQFCQVEEGYHCTKAPSPGSAGVASKCTKSCGDGIQNFDEECDDQPANNSQEPQCLKCRKLNQAICGDFRRTPGEECDDGNNISGDGCSPTCRVESGWTCAVGPTHLDPGVAPGDECKAVCGDGLVVAGEACDDGNQRGDDGCTGDCRVEPLYGCFLPGAVELQQVPTTEKQINGAASVCVRTTPPRLIGAHFDETFATLELKFDSNVAPLPGEEYLGGVAVAAPSFSCSVLLDQTTLGLLGQGPRCWWKSRQLAAIALGSEPGLVPGSSVILKAGVLRRYLFSQDVAPLQERKADVAGGLVALVLWPKPVIMGPQMAPSCADSTTLRSDNSQGLAGRMALPRRWYVAAAFNITNGSWDPTELARIQSGIAGNAQDAEVTFPRRGAILSLLDLEFDRSLRANYLYRICLRQQNVLGRVGISCHHLEVVEKPIPRVEPLVPPGPYTIPRYGRWLNLEIKADLPEGCVVGDAPLPINLADEVPEASHDLTLEEPLSLLRSAWVQDASIRTVWGQQAPNVLPVSLASPLGKEKSGNRSVISQLSVEPGTLEGLANVYGWSCVNASKNSSGHEEVCGYYTFAVRLEDLAVPELPRPARRISSTDVTEEAQAFAAAQTELRLVGLAPSAGAAPLGPPLQAEEGKRPLTLQHLDVLEDQAGNLQRAKVLQFGWLGAVEPENSTTVLGAIILPPDDAGMEVITALAALTPVVTWSVQAETRTGAATAIEPIVSSVGGAFLSIPSQQLSPGSQVQVAARVDLLPPGAGSSCLAPLRSLTRQAVLPVGLPPASGYILVDQTQVVGAPFISFVLESMRWSSNVLPLQYRIEAEFPRGYRVLLNDWSYDPKLKVVLLPRSGTVLMRGEVRDGRGTFSATAPEAVTLSNTAGAFRLLTEFQEGQMSFAEYSPRRTSEALSALESAASSWDPALQLQMWQDVAFSALSDSFNGTLKNCTEDCGQGSCPESLEESPVDLRCICPRGWLGTQCEIKDFEVESQQLLTRTVLYALQRLISTQLDVLGITRVPGSLGRLFTLLHRIGADCRRLPLDAQASLAGFATGLAALVPKAALRQDKMKVADLISQLYRCLPPQEEALPMASMPSPATVLLTALGSSEVCRAVGNAANTTVCYDLASSNVKMSCGSSPGHCRIDLNLGISDPYPCPCSLPDDTFLGFGRSGAEPRLSETMSARSEQDILWRELLKLFWNSSAYSGNISAPGPALAAALWLQEIGAPGSQVSAALEKAEHARLIQQGVQSALLQLAQLLADALLVAAVPGQVPSTVTSLPAVAYWAMPVLVPDDTSPSRTSTAVLSLDSFGTTVEASYNSSDIESSPSFPYQVPMGALRWNNGGRGLFSQMDPSVKVRSNVVQLRMLDVRYNRTKLRYRFMVNQTPSCSQRPSEDLLRLCCNASNETGRPGSFASLSCLPPVAWDPAPVRRAASSTTPRRRGSEAKAVYTASIVEVIARHLPFQQGLESLLEDMRLWTPNGQPVLMAGTLLRLRGGNLKVARACDSNGDASARLILREGEMLDLPEGSFFADSFCRAVFARAKQAIAQPWQTFADLLLEAAEEVLADPSLVQSSTTQTFSTSTVTTSTFSSSTSSSISSTSSTNTMSSTSSTRTTTSLNLTSTSSQTASTTTLTFSSTMSRSTTSSTQVQNTSTSTTGTSTTVAWCVRDDPAQRSQRDTWCPSGVDSETALPLYADVELSDSNGVLLVGVSSVQLSLNESSPLALRFPGSSGRLVLLSPQRSIFFIWAMSEIFSSWVGSWQELHQLFVAGDVLREWQTVLTMTTTSSTMTVTSTSATMTSTTQSASPFPLTQAASGVLLSALELAFSDPLEVFSRALALDLDKSNLAIAESWAARGLDASDLLSSWCQVPKLAPTQNLSDVFSALDPAALKVVDNTGFRPLHLVLEALDKGLPSWWNASYWADSAGGPEWEIPIPRTSTITRTTTSTVADLWAVLCPDVECLPPQDCGVDPSELECVAWSEPLQRFVPALGCTLVAEPGRQWPLLQSGHFELLCECEGWALHPAMAIAERRPELTPFPPQVTITTREYAVSWWDKVNRYNLRGLALVFTLAILAVLHLAVAAFAEVRWRIQARWVAMHAARTKGVQVEVKKLDDTEKDFIKRRLEEIRTEGEFSAAILAAEADATLLQTQGLQHNSVTTTSLDLRHAKDGLATLFQAHGLGDVEDDMVRPALSGQGPSTPTVSTSIVTTTLTKQTPSIAAVSPPNHSSARSQTLSLREAAHEEAFQPEAMILVKQPFRERAISYANAWLVDARQRCTRKTIWHACQKHHKIISLTDDSQTWTFSAPERAAVFHFSLWINSVCLALVLGGGIQRRPHKDPFCPGADHELRLASAGCLLQGSQLGEALLAALWAVPIAALLQTICRGRSFMHRTQDLSATARERAFTRHFLGPWPSMIMAPEEAKARLWNFLCGVLAVLCCCSCCPRPKRRRLVPLHWQPSLVPLCAVLVLLLTAWSVCYYTFFFSSSIYMYEVSRTDTPQLETVIPPDERAEVTAANSDGPLEARLILVPEMQRYLLLLVLSWLMNFLIVEPLLLVLHLFVGEPAVADVAGFTWNVLSVPVRWFWWLFGLCFPQQCQHQAWRFGKEVTDALQRCTNSIGLAVAKLKDRCTCCRSSAVAPLSPEDLQETIESEGEEERAGPKEGKEEKEMHQKKSAKKRRPKS